MKPLLLLSLVFLMLSCGGGGDDGPDNPPDRPRSAQDVIDDFNNLTINIGTNDLVLESLVEGVFWNFRLIVPEGATAANKRPLVLRLHGAAQANSPTAHQSTACLVEPGFEGKDVFILSPNSNGALWETQANIQQILALLDLTTSNLNVDSDKVVITGYSDGGNGSWFFAQFYSNLFAASIPMATSYDTFKNPGKINIPLYVIHGSEDDLFPLEMTQAFVEESIAAGSDITFVVADGLVHNEPCTYLDEFKEAVSWLETEVW
ncbi:dienelactone hydrolase family protein [Lutimonas vermicola]|uniref:Dienelactone hydrolase family protein n=1 Tax=Lutimonas vermicola TaxID=414288 RepID=A0ABU9L079_9FLAO